MLFIHNDPTAPEALLGEAFAESGFDVSSFVAVPGDRVDNPVFDVDFPDPLRYDVIVPLGSRWSVYDQRLAWVAGEIDLVRRAIAAGVGVLGVCFGGQLLASALGGTVTRSPRPEIGWCQVDSVDTALVPHGPWFQWHFDRFTVPAGAVEVARNRAGSQAFVLGRALGLQFHPELDETLLERWIAEDYEGASGELARLGLDADDLRSRTAGEIDDATRRLRQLVRGFLGILERTEHDSLHQR